MNFKEEYKSAMNKISPDEQTALRIEQAVLQKAKPAKKKKPFYVYAGAFSGAAACIVGAILLINFNINKTTTNFMAGGAAENCASAYEKAESESAPQNLTASSSSAARDDILSADGVQDQTEDPAAPAENNDSFADVKNEGNIDMATEASANPGYTLEFQPDESVVVYDGKSKMKYVPDSSVVHYFQERQDLISAKTSDGKKVLIILESKYLYIFEDDLKTADVYKLSN